MPTYYDYRRVYLNEEEAQNLTIGLMVAVFASMAFNWTTPEIAFLVALSVLMLAEVLSITDTLSGFSNDGLIAIGSLFLVIGAIEKSHVVDYSTRKCFGMNSSVMWGKIRMYVSSFFISAIFNNIPQVAVMIPVVKDWAQLRGIAPSQLLIPLSYTVLAGGMLATIGTSTNLVVQGLLSSSNREQFNFFDPAAIGLPAGMLVILYMLVAGQYLLPHHIVKRKAEHERAFTHVGEITISSSSVYCNKPVRSLFEGLGWSVDSLIKIRRTKAPIGETVSEEGKLVSEDYQPVAGEDVERGVELTPSKSPTSSLSKSNIKRAQSVKFSKFEHYYKHVSTFASTGDADQEGTSDGSIEDLPSKYAMGSDNQGLRYNFLPEAFSSVLTSLELHFWNVLPTFFQLPPAFEVVTENYHNDPPEFDDLKPELELVLQDGDVLFVAHAQAAMNKLMKIMPWENKGIVVNGGVSIDQLPSFGAWLVELTISSANPFLNERLGDIADQFAAKYEGVIISAKSLDDYQDKAEDMFHRDSSMAHILTQGSSILMVTSEESYARLLLNREFVSVMKLEKLPKLATWWSFFPAITFITLVSLVAAEQIEMAPAALAMAAFFLTFGWLTSDDIVKYVDLRLLMLMGTSLSFAVAMTKTGLATKIAKTVAGSVGRPMDSLFLIYLATLFITELVSNNAAAALMFPIAVELADELGVSYKPFAMVVMQAASMAFMCPIGYPTHVMVWLPGGYSFMDFVKFGLIPNVIWLIVSCLLCPAVWPF